MGHGPDHRGTVTFAGMLVCGLATLAACGGAEAPTNDTATAPTEPAAAALLWEAGYSGALFSARTTSMLVAPADKSEQELNCDYHPAPAG